MRRPGGLGRMSRWGALLGAAAVVAGTSVAVFAPAVPSAAVPLATESAPWVQVNGTSNGCTTTCPSSPPGRAAAVMAYDTATHQMILFGGLADTGRTGATFNDTWNWTGTGWSELHPTQSPPIRAATAMAYDAATDQLVLFGGQGRGSLLNDTWVWNGSDWTQVAFGTEPGCGTYTHACPTSPQPNSGMSMGYDPATGQLILFSGLEGTRATWDWNGTTWKELTPAVSPPSSLAGDMVYDPASGQLVLFGGQGYDGNATWVWNGTTWEQVADSTDPGCGSDAHACTGSPPVRSGGSMAYDPTFGGLVLFGGLVGPPQLNDTWLWNGTTWSQIDDSTDPGCGRGGTITPPVGSDACSSAPSVRSVAPFARDPLTGQLVLFGGQGGTTFERVGPFLDDTWIIQSALTPPAVTAPWVQVNGTANGCTASCPSSPAGRSGDKMAYDAATHQLILFGGVAGSYSATFNDTWDWNGASWTKLDDAGDPLCTSACSDSPPERAVPAMAYDTATGQLVLFGGQGGPTTSGSYLNDTWVWNGSTWTQVDDTTDPGCTDTCTSSPHATSGPPANTGMSMAYDAATGQLILFSGIRATNETWDWNGTSWTELHPAVSPPYVAVGSMAYDPASRQLVLFGYEYTGNATWAWNGSTWTQVDDTTDPGCAYSCASSPPGRTGTDLAYDPTLRGLVLFGGFTPPERNDTWLWNGTSWTQIDDNASPFCGNAVTDPCPSAPAPRSVAPLASDPLTGQLVLFGGQGGFNYTGPFLNDTWVIQSAPAATTAACIPTSRTCESGGARSKGVTSGGVTVTPSGRGTVDVGTFRSSEVPKLGSSTGKFFGVSVSSDNALKSLVVKDCSLGGGTALSWWNGKAWVHVVPEPGTSITSSGGCLSVTLGANSSPSISTIARLSRLSRFDAVVFGIT